MSIVQEESENVKISLLADFFLVPGGGFEPPTSGL